MPSDRPASAPAQRSVTAFEADRILEHEFVRAAAPARRLPGALTPPRVTSRDALTGSGSPAVRPHPQRGGAQSGAGVSRETSTR